MQRNARQTGSREDKIAQGFRPCAETTENVSRRALGASSNPRQILFTTCVSNVRVLVGAERLGELDAKAAAGWANGCEEADHHHHQCRDRQQSQAERAEHLAVAGPIDQ